MAKAIPPDHALSSHVAPLGLVFDTGDGLPASYKGGKPSGMAQDIVTGFLNGRNEARGRPVGVALDKAGNLLIADGFGNAVWRVTAATP